MKRVITIIALLMICTFTCASESKILPVEDVTKHIERAERGSFKSKLSLITHYENAGMYDQAIYWCVNARDSALKSAETIDFEKAREQGKQSDNPRRASMTKESFTKGASDYFNNRINKITKLKKNTH